MPIIYKPTMHNTALGICCTQISYMHMLLGAGGGGGVLTGVLVSNGRGSSLGTQLTIKKRDGIKEEATLICNM